MNFRTDLALERREYIDRHLLDGIKSERKTVGAVTVSTITVENEKGEQLMGKPKGKYITVENLPLMKPSFDDSELCETLARELRKLLPQNEGTVLVAGLGNKDITPDALGPRCISHILATRHIPPELSRKAGLSSLRRVAAAAPGVSGQTGMETGEILLGIKEKIGASVLIVIDALAARSVHRLGSTVQLCDTGISPGSGVGNNRFDISSATLGIPVIALGVPTVVDGSTLVSDILEKAGAQAEELQRDSELSQLMVTPGEIDRIIRQSSRLLAMAVNRALHPCLSRDDIWSIVS